MNEFKIGKTIVKDPEIISNTFNNFFTNIGKNLANKIPNSDIDPLSYLQPSNNFSVAITPTTESEIIDILKKLKNSSSGYDGIDSRVIKDTYSGFTQPLVYVLNLSLLNGYFPNELKIAQITPIHKSGENNLINNYRPVSLLSVFSKILERLMYDRVIGFIDKHNILHKCQFGFRKKYGTSLALIHLVDKLCQALNEKKVTLGVFIDLKKAFDTVDHTILLRKLHSYGIRGIAYDWFRNYLNERKQFVYFNGTKSKETLISCGVPQGSILGPLLFLLYVNDLPNATNLFVLMFADDTNFFLSGQNENELIQKMNDELNKLSKWLIVNKLTLNVAKTNYMFISGQRVIDVNSNIQINGLNISRVYSAKFLGIIIDHKLNWNEHIHYIKAKLSKSIGIICKAKKYLNNKTLLTLYYSFFQSYLIYGIEIWGSTYATYSESLIVLQNRVVRIIKGVHPRTSTVNLMKELRILQLQKLYKVSVLMFMFKFVKGELPDLFSEMYNYQADFHEYNTRNTNQFRTPFCRLDVVKMQIRYKGAEIWDLMKSSFNHNCSLYTFNRRIKKLLLKND